MKSIKFHVIVVLVSIISVSAELVDVYHPLKNLMPSHSQPIESKVSMGKLLNKLEDIYPAEIASMPRKVKRVNSHLLNAANFYNLAGDQIDRIPVTQAASLVEVPAYEEVIPSKRAAPIAGLDDPNMADQLFLSLQTDFYEALTLGNFEAAFKLAPILEFMKKQDGTE